MNKLEYKEEYGWPTNACLNLTDDCILRCKYCFVEQHPHYMSLDTAKRSVLWLLDNLKKKQEKGIANKKDEISITYFGGEPMMCYDSIIVPLTNWIRENNFPVHIGMTTNGALLAKEKVDFLKKNNISILLSMDGDRETQEYNRPSKSSNSSSFDVLMRNIPYILENFPDTTFRGTIFADTAHNFFNDYIFAGKLGFKSTFFIPDVRRPWTPEQKKVLRGELNKVFSYIDYCFSVLKMIPHSFNPITKVFPAILKHDMNVLDSSVQTEANVIRCGLGTGLCAIGYNGDIYGCQEQVSPENKNIFKIGNIENGIDAESQTRLIEMYLDSPKRQCMNKKLCNNCPRENICTNYGCPSTNFSITGSVTKIPEMSCLWDQWLFYNCSILMKKLVNENNQVFKDYLNKSCNFKKLFKDDKSE